MRRENELGHFDVPQLPGPRQPFVRSQAGLFGRHFARAIAKELRLQLVANPSTVVSRLNALDALLGLNIKSSQAGTDRQFLRYAQAIAQHANALATLLYGIEPSSGLRPPSFLPTATMEALYHMGEPPGMSAESMLDETEAAAAAVLLLRHAALHAAGEWKRLTVPDEAIANPGRPHIRKLVLALAGIYADAFGRKVPTRPKDDSPVARFCSAVAIAMAHRVMRPERALALSAWQEQKRKARSEGRSPPRFREPTGSSLVAELRGLSASRAAGYMLRESRKGGAKANPGART